MSEEEIVNRFLNMIATEYNGDLATQFKNQYILKDKEIERLNNIINNLEEYSETEIKYWEKEYKFSDHYDKANILGYITALKNILNKMKELKEVDKE